MANWSTSPREGTVKSTFDIQRTPATGTFVATITCAEIFGCPVHYWQGRTTPCERPKPCEPCERGRQYWWKAYMSCVYGPNQTHCIFEVTATVHAKLQLQIGENQHFRGVRFKCWRPSQVQTGRIQCEVSGSRVADIDLPPPPDVQSIMEHIWQRRLDAKNGNGQA
jgi:hypothetical protein